MVDTVKGTFENLKKKLQDESILGDTPGSEVQDLNKDPAALTNNESTEKIGEVTKVPAVNITNPPTSSGTVTKADTKYIFNQTGNILISTTVDGSDEISQDTQATFEQVSVFFMALTAALSNTGKSLYDTSSIKKVIDSSKLFVNVTTEDLSIKLSSSGVNFSKELIESVLGLATGDDLPFAAGMINSIGNAGLSLSSKSSDENQNVGTIIFVCEHLLGMPIVSALLIETTTAESAKAFSAKPCISGNKLVEAISITKNTFMFVPPTVIEKFETGLEEIQHDSKLESYISELEGYITQKPDDSSKKTTS
ncbi:hypothetical protein [Photobacterium lutimaris]|uniref:Uncharacterized protein n=1 Tax=Photobacterium lutimaris TaxID=388278 RepID=A0A2T3J0K3_9GAMM|nr:hypothetical protein [Photobacterium lutimaris]PSU34609.1 hypothetical protein C9I99_05780 [Photobacterium lutimaris]TDR71548.1 hypothetical protein DFP78_11682 [Photobacterium lutimaris]